MEEKFLRTKDNVKVAINHYKNGHSKVIIIAHGWFMTKDSRAFLELADILSKDFDIISIDFRGHGKSSGLYTFTSRETIDLKTVVDYAKEFYDEINLLGFSLGGALVLIHGALQKDINKIIAVSAPADFNKIENQMWRKEAIIPTLKKFELKRWLSIRPSFIVRKKFKPIDIVDEITAPTLFIAGKNDPTVFPWHTKALFDKATCPKKFELFENGKHAEDLFLEEKVRFVNLCLDWLNN